MLEYPPGNYVPGKVLKFEVYRDCDPNAEPCIAEEGGIAYTLCGTYHFIAAESDVTASFNGLTGATPSSYSDQSVAPDYEQVVSPGTPTKSGYTFTGWSPTLPRTISTNTTFTAQFSLASPVLASSDITVDNGPLCGYVSGTIDNDNNFAVTAQYKKGSTGSWTTLTTLTANQQNKSYAIGGYSSSTPYTYDIYFRLYYSTNNTYSSEVRKQGTILSCFGFAP